MLGKHEEFIGQQSRVSGGPTLDVPRHRAFPHQYQLLMLSYRTGLVMQNSLPGIPRLTIWSLPRTLRVFSENR